MSRFEIKIALALLVVAAIPMAVALVLASHLVDESVTVGLNPRVRAAVQARAPVVRDFIRSRVDYFKTVLRAAAGDRELGDALLAGDRRGAERALRRELHACQHCTGLRLEGKGLGVGVSSTAKFPAAIWVARTFPSSDEPGTEVRGHPGTRLRLTAVVERRHLAGLRESGEFARFYAVLADKSGSIKRAYLTAFALTLGIAILVALGLGIFLARRVTRRITVLIGATRRVAAGDLDFQIPVRARDEISDLTESFNGMLADLTESQRRIVYLETIAAWQGIARRLAHEIQNPLTPILLAMQQVHSKYQGQEPSFRKTLDEALEVVTEEVQALRALVTEFSDFAKLPAVHLQADELGPWLEELARGEAASAGEVRLSIPAKPIRARFDRMLLRRVIVNLLKNAREASGSEAPVPELSLEATTTVARIEVSDRGPGVPPQARARIFDPYYTTKHEGTGLGLAIVKKIVLDHGGSITVSDRDGGGAVFRIVLPLEDPGVKKVP